MNNRGRYPPGIGTGRGAAPNPDFQPYRQQSQDQQHVQRGQPQNHQQIQLQQQQQQQWSRRPQVPGNASNANDVQKTTSQPEASNDPK